MESNPKFRSLQSIPSADPQKARDNSPSVAGQGELARAKNHELRRETPREIIINVLWDDFHARAETISADQFFGSGGYGAPLGGDALLAMISRLIRQGPPK